MKSFRLLTGTALVALICACNGPVHVTYSAVDGEIPNPERGLYTGTSFSKATDAPVSVAKLLSGRAENRTLFMLEFWLKDFFRSDISEEYLQLVRTNLEVFREGGNKCILRFGYSDRIRDLTRAGESGPFDTTPEQVLRHIAQLKPILQEYADVIFVLQAGFVGCWGEWYYTSHFIQDPKDPEDYLPRKLVCDALLDALPETRQVELRTPLFKMAMYGFGLADTLTRAEAHGTTLKARVAGHNDCFLATANDEGTFLAPEEKEYWKAETRYTIMGGETCMLSEFCKCDNTLKEMQEQHYTYLNLVYNRRVLNHWDEGGCFDEIKQRLGYRLVLTEGEFTKAPKAGRPFKAVLKIRNDGFASVMNPRDAEFVLTDAAGQVVLTVPVHSDPRFWMDGTVTEVEETFTLPEDLKGEYTLSLNLPDPCETLRNKPEFSIRLANEGTWDEGTGYNRVYSFRI